MRPEFLSPHPPVHEPRLIRGLFHGREQELAHVIRDLDPRNDHRQILAIYGETRVGKSHLALRAAQEVSGGKRSYLYLPVNAHQRITTKTVLWEAFSRLAVAALSLEGDAPLKELAVQWIADIGEFHRSNKNEVTIRYRRGQVEEAQKSVKVKGEGSIGSTIFGFIKAKVGFGIERVRSAAESQSQEEEVQITLSPPSEDHLTDIIGFLGSVLVQERFCKRILLLVDDVDLLASETPGGPKAEAENLVDAIRKLAALEAFTVVATVREEFRDRKGKDFRSLCFVPRFPSEASVLEIYDAHVQKLNRGISLYTPEARRYLARNAGGLIGRFFDECDRMRQYFTGADGEWSLERVLEYYRQEAARLAGTEFRPVLGAIGSAATAGPATLGPDAFGALGISIDAIKSSPFGRRVLQPLAYRPDLFEIDPFFLGAWREGGGGEER